MISIITKYCGAAPLMDQIDSLGMNLEDNTAEYFEHIVLLKKNTILSGELESYLQEAARFYPIKVIEQASDKGAREYIHKDSTVVFYLPGHYMMRTPDWIDVVYTALESFEDQFIPLCVSAMNPPNVLPLDKYYQFVYKERMIHLTDGYVNDTSLSFSPRNKPPTPKLSFKVFKDGLIVEEVGYAKRESS